MNDIELKEIEYDDGKGIEGWIPGDNFRWLYPLEQLKDNTENT
jgi:hypothetical protein